MEMNLVSLGAAIAIGLSGVGATIGQTLLVSTAMDILGKNPKISQAIMIQTIIGVALIESIAIYGLIIAFKIIGNLTMDPMLAISAGLAIGVTGFMVGIGEGKLGSISIESLNRNPENKNQVLQFMILFTALLEVIAIYGLIIAYKLIS